MSQVYRRQKPTNSVRRQFHEAMAFQQAAMDFADERKALGDYGRLCREFRAKHGITDGLRLIGDDYQDYLAKRQAEDAARRPGNRPQGNGRGSRYGNHGECRVIKPAGPQRLSVTYEARKEEA